MNFKIADIIFIDDPHLSLYSLFTADAHETWNRQEEENRPEKTSHSPS